MAHLAEHGVLPEEFTQVVTHPYWGPELSRRDPENRVVRGYTELGRDLIAVYLQIDPWTVIPITAYDAED